MPRSETTSFQNQDFVETKTHKNKTELQLSADSNKVLCHKDISKQIHDVTKPIITSDDVVFKHKQVLEESISTHFVASYGNDNSVELSDKKDISIERSKVLSDKTDISTEVTDASKVKDKSDSWIEHKEIIGPTFHRNDSFNKAVNGEEEEGDEDKKSVIH